MAFADAGIGLSGFLSGFTSRTQEIQDQNRQDALAAQQRESKVYEALLNSPDPEVKSHAIAGLLDSTANPKRKGGIRGWLGETAQSPHMAAIKALVNQPVTSQEPTTSLPSQQTSGYLSAPQPGTESSLAQPETNPTEVGAPPPASVLPAPNLSTQPSAPQSTGTHTVTKPRQMFETGEQRVLEEKRGAARGNVEGEISGLVQAGEPEASARAAVRQKMMGRSGTTALQSIAGEAPDENGVYRPAFGVFNRSAGSTSGEYTSPTTGQPIPGFRPKSTSTTQRAGTANNDVSLRLFGKSYAEITPAQRTQVEQQVQQDVRSTSSARAGGAADAKLDAPIGVTNALRYPGTTATTTMRELGDKVPLTENEQARAYNIGQLDTSLDHIKTLIGRVFPEVQPGIRGRIQTALSIGMQKLAGTGDIAELNGAIDSTIAEITRINGVTQRLNQTELALAKSQMANLDIIGGDTVNTIRGKFKILEDLMAKARGTVTPTAGGRSPVGAPPPGGPATPTKAYQDAQGRWHLPAPGAAAPASPVAAAAP